MTSRAESALLEPLCVGILVGGASARMGGVPKGRLIAPGGQRLLDRLLDAVTSALPGACVVLVGERGAYPEPALASLADDPPGVGPIGGLRALLHFARERGSARALALACDLPFLSPPLLGRLGREAPQASALVPLALGKRQPLAAAYAPVPAGAAIDSVLGRGAHSLMAVLDALGSGVIELGLSALEESELRDWDEPADLLRGR